MKKPRMTEKEKLYQEYSAMREGKDEASHVADFFDYIAKLDAIEAAS